MAADPPPEWLWPGVQDPVVDGDLERTAERYGVTADAVASWVADGLPTTAAGLLDPFAVCNWLSWGRLERCPVLARRWRTYLAWFRPFLEGRDGPRRIHWQRRHRCFLPQTVDQFAWFLPRPESAPGQRVRTDDPLAAPGLTTTDNGGRLWRLGAAAATGIREARGRVVVDTAPHQPGAGAESDLQALRGVVEDLVAAWTYGYRRHRREGLAHAEHRWAGSCLDCALVCVSLVEAKGWPARLVGGIVPRDDLVNPHFWVEVQLGESWLPIDPTLPAIARMLGEDWRAWVHAWTGACDGRRIRLWTGPSSLTDLRCPGESAACGEITGCVGGQPIDGWHCLDVVCGETSGSFDHGRPADQP